MGESTNGLGRWMELANLSVVGILILTIFICTIFLVTKGIPKAVTMGADCLNNIFSRHEAAQAESRQQMMLQQQHFMEALKEQAKARTESAKGGHDAAMRIADNIHDLTEEVRSMAHAGR